MYTSGPISGGHLSPVVTLSVFLRRGDFLSLKNTLGYVVAQGCGVAAASCVAYWLLGGVAHMPIMPSLEAGSGVSASRCVQGEALPFLPSCCYMPAVASRP